MSDDDWKRIHQDTENAIEHMKRVIEWAEIGKKRERKNDNTDSN